MTQKDNNQIKIDSIHIDSTMFIDKAIEMANAHQEWESKQEFVKIPTKNGYKMILKSKHKQLKAKGVCPNCLEPLEIIGCVRCSNCGIKICGE